MFLRSYFAARYFAVRYWPMFGPNAPSTNPDTRIPHRDMRGVNGGQRRLL